MSATHEPSEASEATAAPDTPTGTTPGRSRPTTMIAIGSASVLTATTLLSYLVTGGAPNPAMSSLALLPLIAAGAYWRGARWAPVAAVLAVVTLLSMRMLDLSFDLVRPWAVIPFAVAALTVLASGTALTSAVLHKSERDGRSSPRRSRTGGLIGTGLGAVLGLGLVLASPQADDTGELSNDQIAYLPTVDMVNFRFEPGQLRVEEGQPVAFRFTNDTDKSHSFAIEALGIDTTVPSGRTRTVIVEAGPGTYPFVCSVGSHEDNGMVGNLIVVGDPSDSGDHTDHTAESDRSSEENAASNTGEPGHDGH